MQDYVFTKRIPFMIIAIWAKSNMADNMADKIQNGHWYHTENVVDEYRIIFNNDKNSNKIKLFVIIQ